MVRKDSARYWSPGGLSGTFSSSFVMPVTLFISLQSLPNQP